MTERPTEPEWIQPTGRESAERTVVDVHRSPRRAALLLGLAIAAIVVWVGAQQFSTVTPDTALDRPNSDSPVSDPPVPAHGLRSREVLAEDLVELTVPFDGPAISMIITGHAGGPPFRIRPNQSLAAAEDLPWLTGFSADRSGEWLAAASRNRRTGNQVVWVGPIDGDLEPLAADVRGFAWHDSIAGRLGFIAPELDGEDHHLVSMDLGYAGRPLADVQTSVVVEASGWLRLWGEWGFVSSETRNGGWFDAHDPAGQVIFNGQRGVASGFVPGAGIIMAARGADEAVLALDLETAGAESLPWLADYNYVWSTASSGPTGLTALHASNLQSQHHALLIVDERAGAIVDRLPATGGAIAMAWDLEGTALTYILEDQRAGTSLIQYHPETGVLEDWDVSQLVPAVHWTRVISPGPNMAECNHLWLRAGAEQQQRFLNCQSDRAAP